MYSKHTLSGLRIFRWIVLSFIFSKGGSKIPPQISLNIYIIRKALNDLNAPDFAVSILRNGSYQDNAVRLHEE